MLAEVRSNVPFPLGPAQEVKELLVTFGNGFTVNVIWAVLEHPDGEMTWAYTIPEGPE